MQIVIIKEFSNIPLLDHFSESKEICLVAHPDFAAQYGLRYYLKVRQKLQQKLPCHHIDLGIACDDLPGFALEVIAAKVDRLYFLKTSPYWTQIESLCQQEGILIFNQQELSCLL